MNVFITGGTGFVGREVIRQLLAAEHSVRALVRDSSKAKLAAEVTTVCGDTTEPRSLEKLLKGCDAIIHLVGIIREFPEAGISFKKSHIDSTRNLLQAAKQQGVVRFLQMSANGARVDALTDYHKSKWAAEELVRQSALNWTIFRPSLIFGAHDQFTNMLAGLIKKLPLVPVMGDGRYRMQPVYVADVAGGFVAALERGESSAQCYHCGGPDSYSYDQILDLIGVALGKSSVKKLHQPLLLMKPVVKLLQSIRQFPLCSDQLQMLLEGNCCDPTQWQTTFKLELTDFSAGIARYLK